MHGASVCSVAQSCPTLCDPMDSPPGSSVHGLLQARILKWVATSYSRGSSQPRDQMWILFFFGRLFFTTEPPGKPKSMEQTLKAEGAVAKRKAVAPGHTWKLRELSPVSAPEPSLPRGPTQW